MSADHVLIDLVMELSQRAWDELKWEASKLNGMVDAPQRAIPRLDYVKDAQGPAGDPYLKHFLELDYLVMSTLGLVDRARHSG